MKNKIICCFLAVALSLQVCGCGAVNQDSAMNNGTFEDQKEENNSSGEDLFFPMEDLPWQDNSLDAYSAVINVPLRYTEPAGAIEGGAQMYILGSNRASVFKKHLMQTAAGSWDEIKAVTDQGEEFSFQLAFREAQVNQAWAAGGIAGSDGYIMADIERDDAGKLSYRFFETDQDMQVLNSYYVDCLDQNDYEFPLQLQTDASRNLHIITNRNSDDTYHYYIVAPDGSLLLEASPWEGYLLRRMPKLLLLYDGRVAIQTAERLQDVKFEGRETKLTEKLQYVNLKTEEAEILANIESDCQICGLLDEKTLLYADSTGLYCSGQSGEEPEILYTWRNHGVSVLEIADIQVSKNRDISLIYIDGRGANYLKLSPATEKVEIQEITFGVYEKSSRNYQTVVSAFNKQHPACRIRIEVYDEIYDTGLLTELAAGKGPVLMDAMLVGFENNVKYWEPLDEILRQMKLDEELVPKALNVGRIDETLYGIVTEFYLSTVVTLAEELDGWDYDTFLSCFDEDNSIIKSVFTPSNGTDGYTFISNFFYHGLQEKYLFDAESGTTHFDSEKFRKILRLGRYFMQKEHQGTSEGLREGTTLCAAVEIAAPEDLACLRIWGENKLRYIGYPSEAGSRHYIRGGNPITVRVNATAEEKRLAHSFLQFLLSYEAQMEAVSATISGMSVRKDVLEEQINRMNEKSYTSLSGFPQFCLEDQVDAELDGAALYELLEKAEPKQYMPRELVDILNGELEAYLEGNLTEDVLIEHLENRVGLYLSEQK